jgi:hypothetical protein
MNIYACLIDLKPAVNPLAFAHAAAAWFDMLKAADRIMGWQLQRRKLHLAGQGFGDFLLLVELRDLAQLDAAFLHLSSGSDADGRAYDLMHAMIDRFEVGLYRPYPDTVQVERLAII